MRVLDILNCADPIDETLGEFLRDFTDRIQKLEEDEIRELGEITEGKIHLCENIPLEKEKFTTKATKLLKNPQISKINRKNCF